MFLQGLGLAQISWDSRICCHLDLELRRCCNERAGKWSCVRLLLPWNGPTPRSQGHGLRCRALPPRSLETFHFSFHGRRPSHRATDTTENSLSLSLLSHFSFCNISFFLDGSSLPRSVFPSAANEVRPRLHHSRRGCNEAIYWRERSWRQEAGGRRRCGFAVGFLP